MPNGLRQEVTGSRQEVARPGQKMAWKWQKQSSRNWKCLHPGQEVALLKQEVVWLEFQVA